MKYELKQRGKVGSVCLQIKLRPPLIHIFWLYVYHAKKNKN